MTETGAFGAWLRSCRQSAGLSQEALAERAGLSVRAVRNLERGRASAHLGSLHRLADALALQGLARAEFLGLGQRRAGPPASIRVRQGPVSPAGSVLIVPRQLPASVPQFVGRERELAVLTGLLGQAGTRPPAAVISAIGGMAGVGKTALAIHFGHQAAGLFPDGQLYVNLAGFGPSGSPLAPGQAVRGFLDALGVGSEQVPAGLDGQAGLYRSLLSGRRVLVVLDNAADEEQVRPLLPGSPGCLAVVTSRRQLAGLAAAEGAPLITLDCLPQAEALQLLASRLGAERVAAELGAAGELVTLCAGLPLALAIVAARASVRPGIRLSALAAELADSQRRIDVLDAGEAAASVRAVFSWSLHSLTARAERMFALLGLHPGPDITIAAAASLVGIPPPQAAKALDELTEAHLIAEHSLGRYSMHDLLRAYAAEHSATTSDEPTRRAALARMLDHYLQTACAAAFLLNPSRPPVLVPPALSEVTPEHLGGQDQALAWLEAEHHALISAVTLAARSRTSDPCAWQLAWALADFLDWRGHWHEWATTARIGVVAATRLGDTAAQAASCRHLASACVKLADYDQAHARLTECLDLYRQLGDRSGEARVYQALGRVAGLQGRYADALRHGEQALDVFRATTDLAGQAAALNSIGWYHILLGDAQQARGFCRQAIALCRQAGALAGQAHAWDSLGYAEHKLGRLDHATACYQHALNIFSDLGDRSDQAETLTRLGDAREAAADLAGAQDAWQQAAKILADLCHPDADLLRAKIQQLSGLS